MNNTQDNILIMRQQMNEIYRLMGKTNLYMNHMAGNKINIDMLKTEIAAIHELLEHIEYELSRFL